ncbi:MAG: hypothetical protein M9904_07475 [Chitinophagaceae bacterium]|nr:hypothetical protein [Chitinophagaceae bacterium]
MENKCGALYWTIIACYCMIVLCGGSTETTASCTVLQQGYAINSTGMRYVAGDTTLMDNEAEYITSYPEEHRPDIFLFPGMGRRIINSY